VKGLNRKHRPVFQPVSYFFMLCTGGVYVFPLLMAILYSMKDAKDLFLTGPLDMPTHLYFKNFPDAIRRLNYLTTFSNSLILTVCSLVFIILLGMLASYGIARTRGRFSVFIYAFFVAGLLIPGQAIFVPTYLVGTRLHMTGHLAGVIFFYTAGHLPFAVFMLTSFMKTMPLDIEEAATIDGAGLLRTIFTVVLPLLKPAIVSLAVLRSLLLWNDYLLPKLFLQSDSLQTVTVKIANMFGTYRYNFNIAFAAMILSSIPIVIFFVLNQKHIEKGIAAGAVKG